MPGNVPDGSERVRLVELREAEVEHADRDLAALLHEHVRRLDVAMDDPAAMGVGQPVEHLGGDLDGRRVVQPVRPERLAQRAAANVLVRDVDVPGVPAEVVGPHAALVAQARRGLHLACGARRALALAGDDLQRDVEAGPLVAREPHRARAPATERLQGSIAVEDERSVG